MFKIRKFRQKNGNLDVHGNSQALNHFRILKNNQVSLVLPLA